MNLLNGRSFGFYDKRISDATFDQTIMTFFKVSIFLEYYSSWHLITFTKESPKIYRTKYSNNTPKCHSWNQVFWYDFRSKIHNLLLWPSKITGDGLEFRKTDSKTMHKLPIQKKNLLLLRWMSKLFPSACQDGIVSFYELTGVVVIIRRH